MKKPQKKFEKKDIIEIPDKSPKGTIKFETPPEETTDVITNTFVFKNKFGIPIYAMTVQNCDLELMTSLIEEYKYKLDIKELMAVSVAGFAGWLADKGYYINIGVLYINWV